MNDIALYRNPSGDLVTHGSYSARELFRYCPKKFELERVQGWHPKIQRAAPLFGHCVEAAVEQFEKSGRQPGYAQDVFSRFWLDVKELKEFSALVYTDAESDYESLGRAGREMAMLYEIRAYTYPVSVDPRAKFQVPTRKKIFPGTQYDAITNKAYPDIISYPRWDHPLLPKLDSPVVIRPLIIDIKTAGYDYPEGMASLDAQLVEYAWQMNIFDVAFLWFVKKSHDLKMSSEITLLKEVDGWRAGTELLVMGVDKDEDSGAITTVWASPQHGYLKFREAVDGIKGKDRDSLKDEIFSGLWDDVPVVMARPEQVTKQRLRFICARITPEDVADMGRAIGQDTVEMVKAHQEGYYQRTPGTRFPNNKCVTCAMRAICTKNSDMRDATLVRKGEEWLAGLEE